jgi:hypothetical protein
LANGGGRRAILYFVLTFIQVPPALSWSNLEQNSITTSSPSIFQPAINHYNPQIFVSQLFINETEAFKGTALLRTATKSFLLVENCYLFSRDLHYSLLGTSIFQNKYWYINYLRLLKSQS